MRIAGMTQREYKDIVRVRVHHGEWKLRRKHLKREKLMALFGFRVPLWRDRP